MNKVLIMIITHVKKLDGRKFIKEMEKTYNSIDELEKLFANTNNMKYYVDLENWKYYSNHLDEEIELSQSVFKKSH